MIDIEKARILNGKDREETIKTIELKEKIIEEYRQEIERLNSIINELNAELKRYKSIVWLCEKVKDSDKE